MGLLWVEIRVWSWGVAVVFVYVSSEYDKVERGNEGLISHVTI